MEDEMTGLNPEQAQQQIDDLKHNLSEIIDKMLMAYVNFGRELSTKWYSPKAVEFGDKTNKLVTDLVVESKIVEGTILRNVTASYNILARANNLGHPLKDTYDWYFDNDYTYPWFNNEMEIYFQDASPSGAVGMNTLLVKTIYPLFSEQMETAASLLDDIPIDIAFYDPDGVLKQSFKDLVLKFKENYLSKMREIITMVKEALDVETENITIAKQQATDVLTTNA